MPGVLSIAADAPSSKSEGNSGTVAFTFTVTRTVSTSGDATVDFAVTGNTGLDASDFVGGVLPTGQVSFADGESEKTISINVAGDFLVESNDVFTVSLSNPTGGATLGTETATGTILADDAATTPQFELSTASAPFGLSDVGPISAPTFVDIDGDGDLDAFVGENNGNLTFFENVAPQVAFSIAPVAADKSEGDTGTTAFTFTVTRVGNTADAGTVDYAVTGNTGLDESDFEGGVLPSGTVSFVGGETSQTLTINVTGDNTVEPDEGFTVTLSNPSGGGTLDTTSANGTIVNDDAEISVVALDAAKAEGAAGTTGFTFTLTRAGDSTIAHERGHLELSVFALRCGRQARG